MYVGRNAKHDLTQRTPCPPSTESPSGRLRRQTKQLEAQPAASMLVPLRERLSGVTDTEPHDGESKASDAQLHSGATPAEAMTFVSTKQVFQQVHSYFLVKLLRLRLIREGQC